VWNGPQGWLNQHIFNVVSFVDRRFHYFLIRTILNELYKQTHGSGMVHITKGKFEAISVALPPFSNNVALSRPSKSSSRAWMPA
jgi:type I restriction enzyme, S subunit